MVGRPYTTNEGKKVERSVTHREESPNRWRMGVDRSVKVEG